MSSLIRIQRICEQCGQVFEARTTVTRTCSDKCASRAYKARKRAARIAVSDEQTRQIIARPMETIKAKESLNLSEASQLLGVSRWTLWRAIGAGTLPAGKLGRRTLIRRSDIDALFHPPVQTNQPTQTEGFAASECYTLKDIQQKYPISDKSLYDLIRRNNIPKHYRGRYAYVSKQRIDELMGEETVREVKK